MLTSDFDYILPEELIAQEPPKERGISRMLVLHRDTGEIEHKHIADIVDYLTPNDLMVFNDTRVFSARAFGTWEDTPGKVEVLFIEPSVRLPGAWTVMCKSSRPMRPDAVMLLADGEIKATVQAKYEDGKVDVTVASEGDFFEILDKHGVPPVPPYIHRANGDKRVEMDKERYQTVYAREVGAVAAPTAGLHFSNALLDTLSEKGIAREFVTLHVGPGTFRPVKVANVEEHVMDAERYEVPKSTAAAVVACKARGGRVLAVGSTSVRTLETSASSHNGVVTAEKARSTAFIYPPYEFKAVDIMLTNFHLPCSTLLMMICALAGSDKIFKAYQAAIQEKYRFYSYGDCMLII